MGQCKHGKQTTAAVRRRLMGIDWMTRDEIAQAIPPAYTERVGAHLLAAIARPEATEGAA